MKKSFKKLLATVLSLVMLLSLFAAPMSVSAAEETYDVYDEVTYADFLDTGGNPLSADGVEVSSKNFLLHYNVTSESHSVIYKFRWVSGTATYFQMFPGEYQADDPFMYRINVSDAQWWKRYAPGNETKSIGYTINEGDEFDIEIARLKVVTGDYAGQYLSYFKVNGEEIFRVYVTEAQATAHEKYLRDSIQFATNADGATYTIKATPGEAVDDGTETYDVYDEVTYADFLDTGDNPLAADGVEVSSKNFLLHYNVTSESHSVIYKFRWVSGTATYFQMYPGEYGENPFQYRINVSDAQWVKRYDPGKETKSIGYAINAGDEFDIEIGRLKVVSGDYAGQYLSYFKVNGEEIFSVYVTEAEATANAVAMADTIQFATNAEGATYTIKATPGEAVDDGTETYEAYDEIGYNDLFVGENSMNGQTMTSGQNYTYNATSPSYSVIFKYRWIPGGNEMKFSTFFDSSSQFPFCFASKTPNQTDFGAHAGENGAWHLVPSNDNFIVQMDEPIVAGQAYDIEFARLKVANGENAGKYYVYAKVNGELIKDYYYDGVVDGAYEGKQLSNIIKIQATEGNKFTAIPFVEEYEDYDEIGFNDLFVGDISMDGLTMTSGQNYTYNATSPSYSVIFKYRWIPGGNEMKFSTFFDSSSQFPFCFASKIPNQTNFGAPAGENGAWHLVPSNDNFIVQMDEPIVAGQAYDIEFARLKVANGENAGKYYVYAKVNGELIKDYYYDGVVDGAYEGKQLSNIIKIQATEGNQFKAIPVVENYEAYDEIGFNDLFVGDISMDGLTMTSGQNYTYNATSPSYSVIFKYRWIPGGNEMKFSTFFDSSSQFPFCFASKTPNQTNFGAHAGENGAWHLVPSNDNFIVQMDEPIVAGEIYDIEFARLKVADGPNAGKYYVYAKVNGELIKDYYYDGVVDGAYEGKQLSNIIKIQATEGNQFKAIPVVENYEAYDEIGFTDLKDAEGNNLDGQKLMSGENVLTYDKTSPTSSVILKYRWKIGSDARFHLSFDKTSAISPSYMFGAWLEPTETYPNGRMWLRPAYGPEVGLEFALVPGTSHNVEFARLKVASGANAGKYHVYIKIDDVLIAESYVAADVVDANGVYTTDPYATQVTLSNEIFLAFWGSDGNIITSYRDPNATHEGTVCDFDGDGDIDATDLVFFKRILLGLENLDEMSEGIADYNVDGAVNILDLIAMKKDLVAANGYIRATALTLGTQEHLLKDQYKTATYIADASATLGATAYRLSRPIHTLYYATPSNGVTVNETNMAAFREMVEELKANGITEILYVTDSFILPYGYYNQETTHHKTVPDPVTDTENYISWLTVNAAAFKALAQEFPEIKYFEPYNEPNVGGNRLERYGIGWDATEEEQAAHTFTTEEKAGIMADLCWYLSRAVKAVDTANQVTTPSVSADTNHSHVDGTFLDALYAAIEAGKHPTNRVVADKRVDNYFTIVNIHSYVSFTDDDPQSNVDAWATRINAIYTTMKAHNDGDSRVWLTETGMSTYHPDGAARDEDKAANLISLSLSKLDSQLTFVDTVFIYKLADVSSDIGESAVETYYGLFRAGDDLDAPFAAKATAKAVYSYFHNGSTDYSALDALVARYAG